MNDRVIFFYETSVFEQLIHFFYREEHIKEGENGYYLTPFKKSRTHIDDQILSNSMLKLVTMHRLNGVYILLKHYDQFIQYVNSVLASTTAS